jgi:hypothetical protein
LSSGSAAQRSQRHSFCRSIFSITVSCAALRRYRHESHSSVRLSADSVSPDVRGERCALRRCAAQPDVPATCGGGTTNGESLHEPSPRECTVSAVEELPDWERLLAAERHLQHLIPGTVLVGGTAAAIHAGHRVSMDGDHVVADLRERFDHVLASLEAVAGWQTERFQRPVLILGRLEGILTGIRQLRRTRPLETELINGLRVPTLAEMLRIKAWLLVTRHTVRDYLDTVVLCERLGEGGVVSAVRSFDAIYRQDESVSPLAEVAERLAAAAPRDAASVDLATYKGLRPPWNDWQHVTTRGRFWAQRVAQAVLEESE